VGEIYILLMVSEDRTVQQYRSSPCSQSGILAASVTLLSSYSPRDGKGHKQAPEQYFPPRTGNNTALSSSTENSVMWPHLEVGNWVIMCQGHFLIMQVTYSVLHITIRKERMGLGN
jgi:hypothetical protein